MLLQRVIRNLAAFLALLPLAAAADLHYIIGAPGQLVIFGLAADTPPASADGAVFIEVDTAKVFLRTGGNWVEQTNAAYQPLATDLTRLVDNCALDNDSTPIPDSCVGDGTDGGGGGLDTANSPGANEIARFTDADTLEGRTAAEFKADVDLEVGTDLQAFDSDLNSIAALTTTAHGRGLLDDADAAASRSSLSLGTAATAASTDFGPVGVDYLVGTANGTLTGEIAVGTSPGGELGGTWASPTIDDSLTVGGWTIVTSTIDLVQSAGPTPTAEGRIEWETDDDHIIIGDGAAQVEFVPAEDVSGDGSMTDAGALTVNDDSHNHGASTIAALDAGDTTTGTFADARVDGSLESDEVTGLTDAQISDTLTASTSTTAAANDNDTSIATTAFVQQEIDDVDLLSDNCVLENDATPIPDSCVGDGSDAGGGGGAPSDADYLVGTANGTLSAEIVVGTSPGGELGGTWASPTLDDSVSVTGWTIDEINLDAGSASAGSWPNLTSGTLLTTAEDGALELDANTLYFTTDAGNRGYVPVRHMIRANAARTLPNNTNENAIFNSPANGRFTLETGTYIFKAMIGVTGMSATSGNALIDILGAGTATVNDWLWGAVGKDGTLIGVAAVQGVMPVIQSTPASMFTAGTGTELWFVADGTFTVTSAGTLIPSIDLVTAAAATVAIGSFFMVERIGDSSLVSIGEVD